AVDPQPAASPQPAAGQPAPTPPPQSVEPVVASPKPQPELHVEAPKPQPELHVEAPKPQPELEVEAPKPQPALQVEAPKPQPALQVEAAPAAATPAAAAPKSAAVPSIGPADATQSLNDGRDAAEDATRERAKKAGERLRNESRSATQHTSDARTLHQDGKAGKALRGVGKKAPGVSFVVDGVDQLDKGTSPKRAAGHAATTTAASVAAGAAAAGACAFVPFSFGLATPFCIGAVAGASTVAGQASGKLYDREMDKRERRRKKD
ncbi:MAG TPA: hypothetical protein VN238_11835, partial [Solirubrobacteraceae bacterium]|nr:hypothetical protein [Solirubrobacteraceae bacterium]